MSISSANLSPNFQLSPKRHIIENTTEDLRKARETERSVRKASPPFLRHFKGTHSWQAGQVYNTCDFRLAKMLVGVPPNPLELLVTVTRSSAVCSPIATAPGPYALTTPLSPKASPAVRRAAPINPRNLFAGP